MNPFDAIANPFITRDFSTPYIDKTFERERKRQQEKKSEEVQQCKDYTESQ